MDEPHYRAFGRTAFYAGAVSATSSAAPTTRRVVVEMMRNVHGVGEPEGAPRQARVVQRLAAWRRGLDGQRQGAVAGLEERGERVPDNGVQ